MYTARKHSAKTTSAEYSEQQPSTSNLFGVPLIEFMGVKEVEQLA